MQHLIVLQQELFIIGSSLMYYSSYVCTERVLRFRAQYITYTVPVSATFETYTSGWMYNLIRKQNASTHVGISNHVPTPRALTRVACVVLPDTYNSVLYQSYSHRTHTMYKTTLVRLCTAAIVHCVSNSSNTNLRTQT